MSNVFLIIKYSRRNSFESYSANQIEKAGIDVLDEDDIYPNPLDSYLTKIKKLLTLWRYKKVIQNYRNIIVFADGRLPIILTYYLKKRNARLIIWRWNSIGRVDETINKLKKYGEIWTFDKKDAELNGWKLNTQFYFNNDTLKCDSCTENCAYFVGDNKGREELLEKLYDLLIKANVACDFWISNKKGDSIGVRNLKDFVSYEDVVKEVKKHSILVDLVKDGQTGITIRVMEALFYNKKLITNNVAIKQVPFYLESNIFIYGHDDESKLKEFLEQPYTEISNEIKEQYLIDRWVQNFIKETSYEKSTIN